MSFSSAIALVPLIFAAISAGLPQGDVASKRCPALFMELETGCYAFSDGNDKGNWYQGEEYCSYIGGSLLKIDGPEENAVILDYLQNNKMKDNFWAGGYDLGHEGHWYWQSTFRPIEWFDWYQGEPNNVRGDENCLAMENKDNFQWNDENCTGCAYHYICETSSS